jgi:L-threonylcarbamoyladenylate synthase
VKAVLQAGGVVAIPTESSYGLAVDPCNPEAVERVYRLKARDAGKPLPVVAATVEQVAALGARVEGPEFDALVSLWPAPLTLVVPLAPSAPSVGDRPRPAAAAGFDTLAVRIPAHDSLRALLAQVGPVTATSANVSGEPPVLDADGAAALLAAVDGPALVIDGGTLPGGLPSTLVAPPRRVLRQGAFPAERLPDIESTKGDEERKYG